MPNRMKYKTPEEMQEKIEAYFEDCKGHPLRDDNGNYIFNKFGEPIFVDVKPLTVTGLAIALGFTSRQALLNYQHRSKKFEAVVEAAKLRIENYAEMRLYDKDGCNGAKFNLQNNFHLWDADKAGQDDKKAPAVNIICDIPRAAVRVEGEQDAFDIDPETVDKKIKELEGKGGEANG